MARQTAISINTIPIGPLGIIGMPGCEELTDKIDKYLVKWRRTQASEHAESIAFFGYQRDTPATSSERRALGSLFTDTSEE